MRNALLLATFLLLATAAQAQYLSPPGSRAAAMGGASVALTDEWAVYNNQAGLAKTDGLLFAAQLESLYGIEGLGAQTSALLIPTKSGTFGVLYSHYGIPGYNENRMSLSYGMALAPKIAAGVALDYFYTFVAAPYNNAGTATASLGLQAFPTDKLTIGVHVFNPSRSRFKNFDNQPLPVIFRAGAAYQISNKFLAVAEAEKDLDRVLVLKMGGEYAPKEGLYLRAGLIADYSIRHTFGVGFNGYSMRADMGFEQHPTLGYTIKLSYMYRFSSIFTPNEAQ